MVFEDRYQAGLLLAEKLQIFSGEKNVLVLGIPRGGVVVAKAISDNLKTPLDALITKKISAPKEPELAIGAVGPHGSVVLDHKLITDLEISPIYIEKKAQEVSDEVVERTLKFNKRKLNLKDKIIILVDDGIARGATAEVAIKYLKTEQISRLILAVPVIPKTSLLKFEKLVNEVVYLEAPINFGSAGQFYKSFPQISDEEVVKLLKVN